MSNLFYDEHPLIVNPTLARLIGLNESIVLQQVHYWIEIESKSKDIEVIEKHYHNGRWYVYNTFEQWHEQFPFWSLSTLKRTIASLERRKLLLSDTFNKFGYDRTKWYTIDYEMLQSLETQESVKMTQWKVSKCTNGKCQNDTTNTIDYTENTTKEYVKCKMVQNSKSVCTSDYSYEIVIKQIKKICRNLDIEEEVPLRTILYYLESYEKNIGKHHPKMQNKYYQRVIEFIDSNIYCFEEYEVFIDKHFEDTSYGKPIDYNMLHFFTDGIIENRYHETLH